MYRVAILIPLTSAVKEKDVLPEWMSRAAEKTINFVSTGVNLVHAAVTGNRKVVTKHLDNHRTRNCQIDATWTSGDLQTLKDRCPTEYKCETKYRELKRLDRAERFDSREIRDAISSCGSGFWADRFGKLEGELKRKTQRKTQTGSDQPKKEERPTEVKKDRSKPSDTVQDKKQKPPNYGEEYLASHPTLKIDLNDVDPEYSGRIMVDQMNEGRAGRNLPPLQWDQALYEVATLHALRMRYNKEKRLKVNTDGYRNCLIEKTGFGDYFGVNYEEILEWIIFKTTTYPMDKSRFGVQQEGAGRIPDEATHAAVGRVCVAIDGDLLCIVSTMAVTKLKTPQKLKDYERNQCPEDPRQGGCNSRGGGCPYRQGGGGCPFNQGGGGCPFR